MNEKKMTTLNPSVAADEWQSTKIHKESISQKQENEHLTLGDLGENCHLSSLPESLRQKGLFCTWRYESRNGLNTKVPYNPITGQRARSNDTRSFCNFHHAVQGKGYDGIGLGIFGDICAIDIDNCVQDNGNLTVEAQAILRMMNSYAEYSPSGRGIHILFTATNFHYDTTRYYIMNRAAGMEMYVSGVTNKYVTVTGNAIVPCEIGERSEALKNVLEHFMCRPTDADAYQNTAFENLGINGANGINNEHSLFHTPLTDIEIINHLSTDPLWHGDCMGYPSHSEADLALCSKLAFWTARNIAQMDCLFRQSGLMRDKWDRKQSGSTYGSITLRKAIEGCHKVYTHHRPRRDVHVNTLSTSKPIPHSQPQSHAMPKIYEPSSEIFAPLVSLEQETSQLPSFPVHCLPKAIADYVQAVSIHSQTSIDMSAVIAIGVLASSLQGKFRILGKEGYSEPLNLYTMIVASPGERKSGVMRDMTGVLYEYEKLCGERQAATIHENQIKRDQLARKIDRLDARFKKKEDEAIERELLSLQDQLRNMPILHTPRFFSNDCTSEALTSLLAANGGIFSVISTEGGIIDIVTGRYSASVNIDTWLQAHSSDTICVDRKGRETEYIENPALTTILTVQSSVLMDILTNNVLCGRGFAARFLYAFPVSLVGSRIFRTPPIPETVKQSYHDLLYRLMDIPRKEVPTMLTLSNKAADLYDALHRKTEPFLAGEGQSIIEWAAKYCGAVLRIAGLLHAAEHVSDVVEVETMQRAICIGEFFLAHAQFAFTQLVADESISKAKVVVAKLKVANQPCLKRSEVFRMCRNRYFKKTEDIFPTLELLESNGYIRQFLPDSSNSPGRKPDMLVYVNPQLLCSE